MSFRFLHIADVHLDTPFKTRDRELRTYLRQSIRESFENAVDLAVERKTQALLIAGDFFDNNSLSFATEKFIIDKFSKLKKNGINVYYAPGNHDPFGAIKKIKWPSNVKIFDGKKPHTCEVVDSEGNIIAYITGMGHETDRTDKNLVKEFPPAVQTNKPHLGLIHAMVENSKVGKKHEKYAPCLINDLLEKGYSYWALGHIHKRNVLCDIPGIVYPGNIMGRDASETGSKGAYLVDIGDGGELKINFHPLSAVKWITIKADDLNTAGNMDELKNMLSKQIVKKIGSKDINESVFLRIELEGPALLYNDLLNEENIEFLKEELKSETDALHLEIINKEIVRSVNPEEYYEEPHILGAALDLIKRLKQDDELLLKLRPEYMAGCPVSSQTEVLDYLHKLTENVEYNISSRLLKEDTE